jgi:hypothetical protein
MIDTETTPADPWIGKFVIVRCRDAGVHAGILKSREGRQCELSESRRLWRWRVKGNRGITLSDVATVGLDTNDSKVGAAIDVLLTENCEIIACTAEAAENIAQFAVHVPR